MDNQIEYYDLSLQVYKRIKEMILNEQLPPGEKIIQEKLAAELGVSRMPLHKAFQMLENELLVESVPRRGYYVKKLDLQEIIDAFECREAIEGVAARRAAENITPDQIDFLYALFAPFTNDPAGADLRQYEEADFLFHKSILNFSGNKVLQRMEMFGNILIKTYQRGLVRGPKETYYEHISIIDAIARRDGAAAENLLRLHFRQSQVKVQSKMNS